MNKTKSRFDVSAFLLPLVGVAAAARCCGRSPARPWSKNLPSPVKTWEVSRPYVVEPFEKRGELDQGILRFTWYSLVLVAKGYALALLIGHAAGLHPRAVEAVREELRPDHPGPAAGVAAGLAAARPGAVREVGPGGAVHHRDLLDVADGAQHRARRAVDPAGLPERRAGAAALAAKTLFKVLLPATLPYMFTGFRLSLGIAWLVIVAAEMLTGTPGRRRLPLAGVQQPDLRAHHPVHPHHRPRRLRPRPADERRRAPVEGGVT